MDGVKDYDIEEDKYLPNSKTQKIRDPDKGINPRDCEYYPDSSERKAKKYI